MEQTALHHVLALFEGTYVAAVVNPAVLRANRG